MDSDAQAIFTANLDPGLRATVERIAEAITTSGTRFDAAIKWGRLTFAVADDFHHWICGIATTRKGVTLQFHFGVLLPDPEHVLIAGPSRFLRKLEFTSAETVDAEIVAGFTRAAVERLPFFREHWKEIQAGTLSMRVPHGSAGD